MFFVALLIEMYEQELLTIFFIIFSNHSIVLSPETELWQQCLYLKVYAIVLCDTVFMYPIAFPNGNCK